MIRQAVADVCVRRVSAHPKVLSCNLFRCLGLIVNVAQLPMDHVWEFGDVILKFRSVHMH